MLRKSVIYAIQGKDDIPPDVVLSILMISKRYHHMQKAYITFPSGKLSPGISFLISY